LEEQRAQDLTLQAYLDQMSTLVLEDLGDPKVHTLAQARTSTAVLSLDAEHNESVTRFLVNSRLAVRGKASAKLLKGITLPHATLSDANLRDANLRYADLSGANLSGANLSGANLTDAKRWTKEQLAKAKSLEGATMPDGSKHP
jgi:uncharacterized protein YjbI with pentapeptide repeats